MALSLSKNDETELVARMRRGDSAARNRLWQQCAPLVERMARDFSQYSTLELDDLVQEGHLSLVECLETFDPAKSKLVTYAYHCIRNRLYRLTHRDHQYQLIKGGFRELGDS